jgi:hypothetical protein
MSWICPTRIDRLGTGGVRMYRDCEPAPFAHEKGGRASSRAARTSLTHGRTMFSRRRSALGFDKYGSRGRDPSRRFGRFRLQSAFSLVEVLASLFILTLSAAGITAAWRLADYQELLTRVDRRAERILRQYYELQTFAPPDSRPFTINASPSPSPVTGYLYHPRLIANQTGTAQFGNEIPFSISITNGTAPGTSQLVLAYTIPSFGAQASRQVTKTVVLNP